MSAFLSFPSLSTRSPSGCAFLAVCALLQCAPLVESEFAANVCVGEVGGDCEIGEEDVYLSSADKRTGSLLVYVSIRKGFVILCQTYLLGVVLVSHDCGCCQVGGVGVVLSKGTQILVVFSA